MTEQLEAAMADHPDELWVVMERAGWDIGEKSYWRKGVVYYLPLPATDNDAVVACIEWLIDEACLNAIDWQDVADYKPQQGLLIALLIVVRDAMA